MFVTACLKFDMITPYLPRLLSQFDSSLLRKDELFTKPMSTIKKRRGEEKRTQGEGPLENFTLFTIYISYVQNN